MPSDGPSSLLRTAYVLSWAAMVTAALGGLAGSTPVFLGGFGMLGVAATFALADLALEHIERAADAWGESRP